MWACAVSVNQVGDAVNMLLNNGRVGIGRGRLVGIVVKWRRD